MKKLSLELLLVTVLLFYCGCQPKQETTAVTEQKQTIKISPDSTQIDSPKSYTKPESEKKRLPDSFFESNSIKELKPEPEDKSEPESKPIPPEKLPTEENKSAKEKPLQNHDTANMKGNKTEEKTQKSSKPEFYEKCENIFKEYVDKDGMVNYRLLRRKRIELIYAAREFEEFPPIKKISMDRDEKIAMWINAHNIFALKLIVDNYPIQPSPFMKLLYPNNSIMQIPGGRSEVYFKIMGLEYTLNEIEQLLYERFEDPRICFTLSYTTMGGAILLNKPYYPEELDKTLDEQVKRFLATPNGLRIDKSRKILFISNIFNSSKNVFLKSEYAQIKRFRNQPDHIRAYLNFIVKYAPEDIIKFIETADFSVKYIVYDWHLNEQSI